MAYKVQWYIEKQIIFIKFWGEIVVDDLIAQLNETAAFIGESDRVLVHAITDLSEVTKPLPMKNIPQVITSVKQHPHTGWVITVGEKDMMLKFASSVARQLFKMRQQTFDTLPEALAFLSQRDPTIDWHMADESVLTA